MNAHVLLIFSNELRKSDKMREYLSIYRFFEMSLINSVIHEC